MYFYGTGKPKTQKALGISLLHPTVTRVFAAQQVDAVGMSAKDVLNMAPSYLEHVMRTALGERPALLLRPCPMRPRHGFVDSTVYRGGYGEKLRDAILDLANRIIDEDPEGELIVARYIQADTNFVATPANLTLGAGHDGATAGRNAITIPVANPALSGEKNPYTGTFHPGAYGVGKDEWPYVEGVTDGRSGQTYVTQVRAGPAVPMTVNYVPEGTHVERVIRVDTEDLLEWERRMADVRGQVGTVVYHPGGALTSHFGVHAVLNGIPYVTSYEPMVGDTLDTEGERGWDSEGYRDLGRMLATILHEPPASTGHDDIKEFRRLGEFGFATLHASAYLIQHDSPASRLTLAHGIAAAARVFLALSYGEVRHISSAGRGKSNHDILTALDWDEVNRKFISSYRENVYVSAYKHTIKDMARYSDWAVAAFEPALWSGRGYGGRKWRDCAQAAHDFLWSVIDFVNTPGEKAFREMMTVFNRLITLAHNGGWWLNKIMHDNRGNLLSVNPQAGMVTSTVHHLLTTPIPDGSPNTMETFAGLEPSSHYNDQVRRAIDAMVHRRNVAHTTGWAVSNGEKLGLEAGASMLAKATRFAPVRISMALDMGAIFEAPDGTKRVAQPFHGTPLQKLLHSMFACRQFSRVHGRGEYDSLDARLIQGKYPGMMVRLRTGWKPARVAQYIEAHKRFIAEHEGSDWFVLSFTTEYMLTTMKLMFLAFGFEHSWLGLTYHPYTTSKVSAEGAWQHLMNESTPLDQTPTHAADPYINMLVGAIEHGLTYAAPGWAHYLLLPDVHAPTMPDEDDENEDEDGDSYPDSYDTPPPPEDKYANAETMVAWSDPTVTGYIYLRSAFGTGSTDPVQDPPNKRKVESAISTKEAADLLTAAFEKQGMLKKKATPPHPTFHSKPISAEQWDSILNATNSSSSSTFAVTTSSANPKES